MNYLIVLVVLLVASSAYGGPDDSCDAGVTKCSADCSSLILCPSKDKPLKVSCSVQSGGTNMYCNSTAKPVECSKENSCDAPDENPCEHLKKGFYPDLLDCTKFYYCSDDHKIEKNACDGTDHYNPLTELCDSSACNQFSSSQLCKGHAGQLIMHPVAKYFYIYCGSPPELFSCDIHGTPGYSEYNFDPNTATCVFKCLKAGNYPSETGPEYYYQCTAGTGGVITPTEHKCGTNSKFVADGPGTGRCVHSRLF